MKRTILLIASLTILSLPLLAQNWPYFPKTNVWEVFVDEENTALNNGIAATDADYPDDEAIILRYYPNSNPLGNSDTQAIINNYNVNTFPSAYFNRDLKIKSAKAHLNDGNPFKAQISKHLYDPAAMFISNLAFNTQSHTITCSVIDALDENVMPNLTLQYLVVEDNVSGVNNVVRKTASDQINFTSDGALLQLSKVIDLDQSWNVNNLKIVALVRDNEDKILQAASTNPVPFNKLRLVSQPPRYAISNSEFFEMPYIDVMNTAFGANAIISFSINVLPTYLPNNWMLTYCDHSECYLDESDHTVEAGQYFSFHPSVMPNGEGSALFYFNVTVDGMPDVKIPFNFLTPSADILMIDDDGVKSTETAYLEGLNYTGMSYAIADMNVLDFDNFNFSNYNNIIWNMHNPYTTVPNTIIPNLNSYITEGGNLYLAGTSVGWAMTDDNSTFKSDATNDFYASTIGAAVGGILDNSNSVIGIAYTAGDGFNLSFAQTPEVFRQVEPEYLALPTSSSSTPIFINNGNNYQFMGISNSLVLGKIIYTAFSLEGMNWNSNNSLSEKWLTRVMYEFGNETATDEIVKPINNSLRLSTYPNPFSQATQIKIDSQEANANLEIFNVKGQRVHKKTVQINNGTADYTWNMNSLPSGVYFIKVSSGNQSQTKKVLSFK